MFMDGGRICLRKQRFEIFVSLNIEGLCRGSWGANSISEGREYQASEALRFESHYLVRPLKSSTELLRVSQSLQPLSACTIYQVCKIPAKAPCNRRKINK
jgi:hypothetical protein